jgi:small subunit ribosomal protein S25e
MGGNKKRPVSASEKTQGQQAEAAPSKPSKKQEKGKGQAQQKSKITVLLDEKAGLNTLKALKGITPQALARSAGVKISIANIFLRALESKGAVRYVGGYSGHRVYELIQESKPAA